MFNIAKVVIILTILFSQLACNHDNKLFSSIINFAEKWKFLKNCSSPFFDVLHR